MNDHIPMLLMIQLKFSVSNTVGFLKEKSVIRIFRDYLQVKRNFIEHHFWARGYCVSTVGLDEQVIREYIRNQEKEEKVTRADAIVRNLTTATSKDFYHTPALSVVAD
jgi:putative transposase